MDLAGVRPREGRSWNRAADGGDGRRAHGPRVVDPGVGNPAGRSIRVGHQPNPDIYVRLRGRQRPLRLRLPRAIRATRRACVRRGICRAHRREVHIGREEPPTIFVPSRSFGTGSTVSPTGSVRADGAVWFSSSTGTLTEADVVLGLHWASSMTRCGGWTMSCVTVPTPTHTGTDAAACRARMI